MLCFFFRFFRKGLNSGQGRTLYKEVSKMRTDHRLTQAYQNARIEYFDEKSRYVFISDCHRGDGGLSDEFTKNENTYRYALDYYFKNGFVYVEAGDGDELWEHPKFKTIKNAHYDVFKSIKNFHDHNRLIIIYGNHNVELRNPKYVEKNFLTYYYEYKKMTADFLKGIKPCEALVLKNKETGQEILTVHGHQGDFPNDQFWLFSMLSLKFFWRYMHAFGFQNPASPVKNINKQHKIEKNCNKWIAKNKMMLICGHTHRFKYPRDQELPYFNTGCCIYPTSMTAIEICDGVIQMVRWRTVPNENGFLKITRAIIRGPDPVISFDIRNTDTKGKEELI